ncbi:TauD/TfdA family dioxygenase [Streptomyces sp. HB2AG]|uniref:TauD/TfdA family dioxygenase n=1 Tax=Streptomyces sp. HB2AG TaxID=2983400 RepID=UPI0022AA423F|nr:TauD/TfdA family dioxygenase [Streptomyces sp. HB2AG]MCZ2524798.1 TauD/TfdA family dioxygenase [Streptomyces sp. HB2AG]
MPKLPDSVLSCFDVNGDLLPEDVLKYAFRQLLSNNGYVQVVDVPESFDHVAFLKELGDFQPTPTGTVVGDLKPESDMDDIYHAQNRRPLVPHTEGYEFRGLPPRYLSLWCVKPASGAGGETTMLDGRRVLEEFTEEEQRHFRETVYHWKSTEGLARRGVALDAEHPVLEDRGDETVFRFSFNNLVVPEGDELAARLLRRGKEIYDESHVAVRYRARDMIVWDNWRMMHSRNAFDDPTRHLKRVQIAAPVVA